MVFFSTTYKDSMRSPLYIKPYLAISGGQCYYSEVVLQLPRNSEFLITSFSDTGRLFTHGRYIDYGKINLYSTNGHSSNKSLRPIDKTNYVNFTVTACFTAIRSSFVR